MAKDDTAEIADGGEVDENEPLSALDLPAAPPTPIDTRDIPLGDIQQLDNIRPHFHGIEGLAETMHTQGQLQPCLVRPALAGSTHGRPFELIFGYRRYLAAESLGWEMLRCEVREVPDENKRRQLIIENFAREPLSSLGIARAMYELKYTASPPLSNAEVARQLGCDPSQVSHRLTMLIKLAPPRSEGAPAPTHELAEQRATPPVAAEGGAATATTGEDGGPPSELDPAANTPLVETPPSGGSGVAVIPVSELVLPGDSSGEDETPPELDILALVDEGIISASTAEVIASMDSRENQEKLTKLVLRNDWGVKKAAEWARGVKRNDLSATIEGEDELGPIEMLEMEDVVPLQTLVLRPDLSDLDVEHLVVYMQLRNGMDREMLDYIEEHLQYPYERLWEYVSLLSAEETAALKKQMAVRYVTSAHRFFALEPSLRDELSVPEDAPAEQRDAAAKLTALSLPGIGASDDLLALGPETDEEDEDNG